MKNVGIALSVFIVSLALLLAFNPDAREKVLGGISKFFKDLSDTVNGWIDNLLSNKKKVERSISYYHYDRDGWMWV